MSPDVSSGRPEIQGLMDDPAIWSRAWRKPRSLAIGSASYYAQEHGLTIDFKTESSKRAATHLISIREDSQNGKDRGLSSYSHLTQCTIPAPKINDCWVDTEPAAQYLQQLLLALDDSCMGSVHVLEPRFLETQTSRCELPILKSDNNLDLLGLVRNIYSRSTVPLAETTIPLMEMDVPGDEDLRFPCWSDQLRKHFDSHLFKEGTQSRKDSQLPGDAHLYDGASVGKPDKESVCGLIDTEFAMYKEIRPRGAVLSSPLLPAQFTYDVFVPDSDTCVINCFSDAEKLLHEDIKQVESRLTAEHDGEDTLHSELQTPPESSPVFPAPKGQKISSLKVEVPLTGPMEPCQGRCDDEALIDALESVRSLCGEAGATVADFEQTSDPIPILTGVLATQVQDAGEQARRRVEQERLSDPGSSRRVPVPVMDFTILEPGWKKLATSAASLFKLFGGLNLEVVAKRIKTDAREERKLRWRPLNGSSGKVVLSERVTVDTGKLELFLNIRGDAEASGLQLNHLFRRQTLQFLEDSVDGNEETVLSPLPGQTCSSFPSPEPLPSNIKTIRKPPNLEETSSKKPRIESRKVSSRGLGLLDEGGSDGVGGLLTSYLQIRAPEKTFPMKSAHFSEQAKVASTGNSFGVGQPVQRQWGSQAASPQAPRLPVLCPEFDPRETGSRYIVSTSIGKPVIQQLDQLCPMAKLYARDFTNLAKSTSASGTRGKGSLLCQEADIVLSSSTGVVVISMTQLRQKFFAREGQSQLRQKLETVATMYDKVIVLVPVPITTWTSDNTRTYTEFVAFVNMLNSSIEPVLIGDSDDCLGKWIICLMNEYRYEGRKNEHLLVQGETSWEPFFRFGGMNVYAAQVLSGSLTAAYGDQGLARLLAMKPEERVSAFEAIIGTRRPLDNLSRWVSKGRS